jgi:hypothetical protein
MNRYFTTNESGFLNWVWDGTRLWYSCFRDLPLDEWGTDEETLEELNTWGDHGSVFSEDDPMYAYETDEHWKRLT